MNILGSAAASSRPPAGTQILVPLLSIALLFGARPQNLQAHQDQDAQAPPQTSQAQPYAQQTPEQLQQLVAPIALYPDSLVAQILAASTFPEQVVEADRWVQAHPGLQGAQSAESRRYAASQWDQGLHQRDEGSDSISRTSAGRTLLYCNGQRGQRGSTLYSQGGGRTFYHPDGGGF